MRPVPVVDRLQFPLAFAVGAVMATSIPWSVGQSRLPSLPWATAENCPKEFGGECRFLPPAYVEQVSRFLPHHKELPMKYVLMYTNRPDLDAAVPADGSRRSTRRSTAGSRSTGR